MAQDKMIILPKTRIIQCNTYLTGIPPNSTFCTVFVFVGVLSGGFVICCLLTLQNQLI